MKFCPKCNDRMNGKFCTTCDKDKLPKRIKFSDYSNQKLIIVIRGVEVKSILMRTSKLTMGNLSLLIKIPVDLITVKKLNTKRKFSYFLVLIICIMH